MIGICFYSLFRFVYRLRNLMPFLLDFSFIKKEKPRAKCVHCYGYFLFTLDSTFFSNLIIKSSCRIKLGVVKTS